MEEFPLISIVTPSYNQGQFLGETLQSLLDQYYPKLEVIIQDGGSTDGAITVAQEFVQRRPDVFQLYVEKDSGQADALNRGFARTRGEILGFLNSDDTLYPGCLLRVAREIDGQRGRHIVFGRCLFTGEGPRYVGVEHPAEYESHFDLLAIWRRGYNTLPQPSVFWHRRVWETNGGFNPNDHHVLDYDLFCRFSRDYRFHKIDELWSTFRMHDVSKSSQRTEAEVLALSVATSRRYWGSWFSPLRWRCELSYWFHRQNTHEQARHHARRAEEAAQSRRRFRALSEFLKTAYFSPKMARDRLLRAWLADRRLGLLQRLLWTEEEEFSGLYGDGWIGPIYRMDFEVPTNARRLVLTFKHHPHGSHQTIDLSLAWDRKIVARHKATTGGDFIMTTAVEKYRGKRVGLELRSGPPFVPRLLHNTPDDRRLVVQLLETKIETD
jgi:glycosyltransferase involved in cell wall biosynthesis